MICPVCKSNISDKRNRCERCGTDVTIYKKILRTSNLYYNNGLARAKVRDLTGAAAALRNCLELNKLHTNARNLLGLVYFEMGETVAALSEWVISKHFQQENNDADEYINKVQSNPTKLENLNQAIKRYNNALTFARQGSDDLAMIQLKKVVSLNPHFIRAYHLLALLHMKNNEKDKAKKCLLRAGKIDVSNTTTLLYLKELEPQAAQAADGEGNSDTGSGVTSSIMPISSYREDKPNIMAFVNLVIGVIVGIAVTAFLIVPSMNKKKIAEDNEKYSDYSSAIASLEEKEEKIKVLEADNEELIQQKELLQAEIDSFVIPEDKTPLYDPFFDAIGNYLTELEKTESNRDYPQLAQQLASIDINQLERTASITLLNRLKEEIYPKAAEFHYQAGRDYYRDSKYEEALAEFTKAMTYDPKDDDAIYYRARSYHQMEDTENAAVYYEIILNDFPDSDRRTEAQKRLDQIRD